MNRTVYFDDNFIYVGNQRNKQVNANDICIAQHEIDKKSLVKAINAFLKGNHNLIIETEEPDKAWKLIVEQFYYIEAAGGLIEKDTRFLFIKRLGKWDLPKGKMDKGETINETAIRECEEECGISELKILRELPATYHIYTYKDGYALKVSYWFFMKTTFNGKLTPQTEENITELQWFKINEIKETVFANTYPTIKHLLEDFFKLHS